ncbi:MAG: J domain-containing protein [Bacteroidota bacterium]
MIYFLLLLYSLQLFGFYARPRAMPDITKEEAYTILGCQPNASKQEIRNAYKLKAREYHPDNNLDNTEEATKKFQKLGQAYDRLTKYGKYGDGHHFFQPNPHYPAYQPGPNFTNNYFHDVIEGMTYTIPVIGNTKLDEAIRHMWRKKLHIYRHCMDEQVESFVEFTDLVESLVRIKNQNHILFADLLEDKEKLEQLIKSTEEAWYQKAVKERDYSVYDPTPDFKNAITELREEFRSKKQVIDRKNTLQGIKRMIPLLILGIFLLFLISHKKKKQKKTLHV